MSDGKQSLAQVAVEATENGKQAQLYFGAHTIVVTKATLCHDVAGVLVCETVDEQPFSIDVDSIEAVLEKEPFM